MGHFARAVQQHLHKLPRYSRGRDLERINVGAKDWRKGQYAALQVAERYPTGASIATGDWSYWEHPGRKQIAGLCGVLDCVHPKSISGRRRKRFVLLTSLQWKGSSRKIMGWHGQKRAWAIRKLDELDALNVTIRRMLG
jgi:hypothetical protein